MRISDWSSDVCSSDLGHMRGIEDTRLVDDEARADAARLLDELDARFGEFGDLARRARVGLLAVMTRHISVEAGDQFPVGDRFGGGGEEGPRTERLRYVCHGCPCGRSFCGSPVFG